MQSKFSKCKVRTENLIILTLPFWEIKMALLPNLLLLITCSKGAAEVKGNGLTSALKALVHPHITQSISFFSLQNPSGVIYLFLPFYFSNIFNKIFMIFKLWFSFTGLQWWKLYRQQFFCNKTSLSGHSGKVVNSGPNHCTFFIFNYADHGSPEMLGQ